VRVALIACAAALAAAPAALPAASPVERGRQLYAQGCISCHGQQGQGVEPGTAPQGAAGVHGEGPSLHGVGALAADFYLRTGYMPLKDPHEQPKHRRPKYPDPELRALVAYIAAYGGPAIPRPHPERGSESEGLRLFTENCAGCHQVVARGGLVTGAVAPPLDKATATQIAEAVRIGPYVMPRFSTKRLSDRELDSIIRYVQLTRDPVDRGGWSIGNLGPIPEGIVAWLLAGSALVLLAAAIGQRVKK